MKLNHKHRILMIGLMILLTSTYAIPSFTAEIQKNTQGPFVVQKIDHNIEKSLTQKIESILEKESQEIKVIVKNKTVYLYGDIDGDERFAKIITMVATISEVEDINADHIMVKNSQKPLYDLYIMAKVRGTLKRNKLKNTNMFHESIVIKVSNGQVFLSGLIPNQAEKQKILNVVRSVKGVIKINDQLNVQSK